MSVPAFVSGFITFGYHTETAGTTIDESVPGVDNKSLALLNIEYLAAATAHDVSVMYASGTGTRTTASAAAAISQAVLNVDDAPKDPSGNATASGDIIAYQVSTGAWEFNTVASLSTKAITLTNNIAVAVLDEAKVRIFGIVADGSLFSLHMLASVVGKYGSGDIALVHPYMGDPFYVSSDNATNAGFLNNMVFGYINKSGGGAT